MLRKKIILGLLIISISFLFFACSNNEIGDADSNEENFVDNINNIGAGEADETTALENDRWREIEPNLPDADFEGYEFNVLVRSSDHIHWLPWEARDIISEELNGEPINDAVFRRNSDIEAQYNITIVETKRIDHATMLRNTISAGDDMFDLYYADFNSITSVAAQGFFHDLLQMPYIDLEAPWWDQNAKESLSIANMLFFCTSDLILLHNDSTSALVFNKELIRDYGMDDPHQLVHDGLWTVDRLYDMSRNISYDLDGNGIMDENDMYGFIFYRDASLSLMHGAGGRIARKDSNDLPYLTLGEELPLTALSRAFDVMYAPSGFNVHRELEGRFDAIYLISHNMFMENRALFYWILLHDIVSFREMDADFGILPIPKLNEHQETFGHTVNQFHGNAMAVPITVQNTERTGIILEALTARSRFTLLPAYYEISLQRKFTRDDESADMLDIIFSTQVYDLGAIYNFGGYSWEIIWMTMSQDRDIVTLVERRERIAERDIERMIDRYLELAESR